MNEKKSDLVGSIRGNDSYSQFFSLDAWAEKNLPFLIVPKASSIEKGEGNNHPTVKPIKLMSYLITMGSREGDVVLDPFCGSGSTCVAAKMLKRKYIGIELDERYREIAVKRIKVLSTDYLWFKSLGFSNIFTISLK